jgi:hypothetical protein
MADKNEYLIRKYHATGTVAYSSIDNVLKSIQPPQQGAASGPGSVPPQAQVVDWGNTMSQVYNATKQLDSLWSDMDPIFSLVIPVPKKPFGTPDSGLSRLNNSVVRNTET